MEKQTMKHKLRHGAGALRITSALCFWLALAVLLAPVADTAAPASAMVGQAEAGQTALTADAAVVTPQSDRLIPLGRTTGIKMFSEGAMVVGFAQLEQDGGRSPAQRAGMAVGDIIVAVNGHSVGSNEELVARLAQLEASAVTVTARRDGETLSFDLEAVYDGDKAIWRMGAWVRDSIAGIGTITFVDPENGAFGALGHGISDADTGQLMTFEEGSIMESTVAGVKKGQSGAPGELTGRFDLTRDQGVLFSNTGKGIFGQITNEAVYADSEALEIAKKAEIQEGPAHILSNVEGQETRAYQVEIVRIYADGGDSARDMMLRVVDDDLIAITGGIVQGMSGSPIIQNGKLVGAVTHVLVNDPLRGYGISMETMLSGAVGA